MEDLLQKALAATKKGQSYAFATIIESTPKGTPQKAGAKMVVLEDGTLWGTIGGGRNEKAAHLECMKAIKSRKPCVVTYDYFGKEGQSVCGGQIKVFIEPFVGKKHLIICGSGHIALPLSALGKILNFNVTIVDDRKELANRGRFPHVDEIVLGRHAEQLSQMRITQDTYIMIVTQGNEYDFECLKVVIKSAAGYIGVISSQPKRIKFFKRLREFGIPQKRLDEIHIPAGLDIGAQTPEEIAISITAGIIARSNKEFIGTAKFEPKSSG